MHVRVSWGGVRCDDERRRSAGEGEEWGGGCRWEAEVEPSLNSVCQQTLFQQAREVLQLPFKLQSYDA